MQLRIALGAALLLTQTTIGCGNNTSQYVARGQKIACASRAEACVDHVGKRPAPFRELANVTDSELRGYLELLENPNLAWSSRVQTSVTTSEPAQLDSTRSKRAELESLLARYSPRLWWHNKDPFAPMDPLTFINNSSLWLKRSWGPSERIAAVGEVNPSELGRSSTGSYARRTSRFWESDGPLFSPSGFIKKAHADDIEKPKAANEQNYFLKYEDPTQGSGEIVDWDFTPLKSAKYTKPFEQGKTPIFWRLGQLPRSEIVPLVPGAKRVLIEYWYHVPFSKATSISIGNHQGDWEGMAVLLDLSTNAQSKLDHKLAAVFFAEHDGGAWHCPNDVQWADGHLEAFSAAGTHATYARAGAFKTGAITDYTERGRNWDTWNLLKPMVLEPYYGYAGHWGERRFLPYSSGPTSPGSPSKWLPNARSSTLQNAHLTCS